MTSEQETKRLAREASRLDKECPPAIYVALHCGCIATYGEHPTQGRANLKYIRSDLAEQREAELVALLEVAQCPQCNGSGVVQEGNGSIYECQWHHERKVLLAKHKAEGREG